MLYAKAFHIIALVSWFAGLFYLPRLFVYHADTKDSISLERFKIMERRLFYGIMNPAAVLTIIFGMQLVHYNPSYYYHIAWMQWKFILVFVLIAYHISLGFMVHKFKADANCHSSKFYRFYNEVPTLILISVVLLVVVKP